jgi:coenzyme Q-binding protein COQ10
MSHSISREVVIEVPRQRLWSIIVDYERYPEFVPSMRGCRVLRREGGCVDAEYDLDLGLKRIRYTLRHLEEAPARLTWHLVGGEWMKISNGSWDLADLGGRTRAHYSVEVQITKPPLVPQSLVDRFTDEMTKVQLPRTLDAFKLRAERSG